ncbi:hypothetical protein D8T88_23550 [Salmonella enterica]|nr:hypothetical protein [Salmonella enterica]
MSGFQQNNGLLKMFITRYSDLKRYCLGQMMLFIKEVMEIIIVKINITTEIVIGKSLKMK